MIIINKYIKVLAHVTLNFRQMLLNIGPLTTNEKLAFVLKWIDNEPRVSQYSFVCYQRIIIHSLYQYILYFLIIYIHSQVYF